MQQPLTEIIELFTATKKTEGLSRKTTDWYGWMLRQFATFLGDPPLSSVTLEEARHFIPHLQNRENRYLDHPKIPRKEGGSSAYTISRYVRTLKVFGKWLYDEGLTKSDLFAKLRSEVRRYQASRPGLGRKPSLKLVQQRPGFDQVHRVEPLGEPTVNAGQ